jgi:hypothetical protein
MSWIQFIHGQSYHLIPLPRSPRETDLVLRVIAINQVLHDASRLEEIDRVAIGEGVGQGGNAAIGINRTEPGLFLGVFADVDFVDFVGETSGLVSL